MAKSRLALDHESIRVDAFDTEDNATENITTIIEEETDADMAPNDAVPEATNALDAAADTTTTENDEDAEEEEQKDSTIKMLIKPKLKITFSQVVCLLISLFLFAYPVILDMVNNHTSDELITSYSQHITANSEQNARLKAEADAYNDRLSNDESNYTGTIRPEDQLIVGDGSPFAWIEIPKLEQKIPIYHGTSYEVLQAGVGHMERTSIPVGGESTHAVLTAHSGMRGSRMFDDIPELKVGDIFLIHILDETLAYKVYGFDIVEPHETSSLKIQKGRDLVSLLTCYPYGINTHRYIVHAERTDYDPNTQLPATNSQFLNSRTYPLLFALLVLITLIALWWKMRPVEVGHNARKLKRLVRHDKLPDPALIERVPVTYYEWKLPEQGIDPIVDEKTNTLTVAPECTLVIHEDAWMGDAKKIDPPTGKGYEIEWQGDKRKKCVDYDPKDDPEQYAIFFGSLAAHEARIIEHEREHEAEDGITMHVVDEMTGVAVAEDEMFELEIGRDFDELDAISDDLDDLLGIDVDGVTDDVVDDFADFEESGESYDFDDFADFADFDFDEDVVEESDDLDLDDEFAALEEALDDDIAADNEVEFDDAQDEVAAPEAEPAPEPEPANDEPADYIWVTPMPSKKDKAILDIVDDDEEDKEAPAPKTIKMHIAPVVSIETIEPDAPATPDLVDDADEPDVADTETTETVEDEPKAEEPIIIPVPIMIPKDLIVPVEDAPEPEPYPEPEPETQPKPEPEPEPEPAPEPEQPAIKPLLSFASQEVMGAYIKNRLEYIDGKAKELCVD